MQVGRKLAASAALLGAAFCLPLAGCVDTASQVRVEPVPPEVGIDLEQLYARNLVSGVVDARR
mgnify:CR=1 FL=1